MTTDRMDFLMRGIGNRGTEVMRQFMNQPDVEVVALCDCYKPHLDRDQSAVDPNFFKYGQGVAVPKFDRRDFLDRVKDRGEPLCTLETGHRSTSFALLGNIAYHMGQRLEWDGVNERFTNCEKANELLHYKYREGCKLG